jgi:hypothetical protein
VIKTGRMPGLLDRMMGKMAILLARKVVKIQLWRI